MNKTVIITGVDGLLGGKITRKILSSTDWNILGLTMSLDMPERMLEREGIEKTDRIRFMTNGEFLDPAAQIGEIYGAVHLAFSRRMQPPKDIASSIDFAASVFHRLAALGADRVINMSSQGVYGNTDEIRTEATPAAPDNHYTMAKYATEKLFEDILAAAPHHTSFRLDPVTPSQNVIEGLCKSAREGKISLRGGKQVFSLIDPEDAASAVVAMLAADGEWESIYNVGWNRTRYTLVELAEIIADAACKCGYARPEITLDEADIAIWAGMDSSRFMQKTGWEPTVTLSESVCSVLKNQ